MAMGIAGRVLYTRDELPLSFERRREVELLLLCFMQWLSRIRKKEDGTPLRGSTINAYCDHVQMWMQHFMGGIPFRDVMGSAGRIAAMRKAFIRERPSRVRDKKAFTPVLFRQLQRGVWLIRCSQAARTVKFRARRLEMMVAAGLEGLLRTSEMALGATPSAANLEPFALSDLHWCYKDTDGSERECMWNEDGTIDTSRAMWLRVPMSSSKPDQFGERGDQLFFPRSAKAGTSGTFEITSEFVNAFPIVRWRHPATPWMRQLEFGMATQVTHAQFMSDFKTACRAADVRYEGFGKHAFRIGGMNALQDAGATVPEIMALGRWTSDAWRLYARREQRNLLVLTARVLLAPRQG